MSRTETREDKIVGEEGSTSMAEAVRALRQPATYPGKVHRIEVIETHRSWVFLAEAHAYKLKKAIGTSAVSQTTLSARRTACETELLLNRRLAPSVYVAVVVLARANRHLCLEGTGAPIDWLVKMRRLPRDRILDACIARGAVQHRELDELVDTLTRFYRTAERAPLDPEAFRNRITADLLAKRASLEQPRYRLPSEEVGALGDSQARWLKQHGHLLEARADRVVDAHGDLRPEHICFAPEPMVIDCLEFDRELRLLDPVSELSFLALECQRLGAAWIAERLLTDYQDKTGDVVPASLVSFYKSYHALVRAAVAIWHLDDHTLASASAWRERSRHYLRMGAELLACPA